MMPGLLRTSPLRRLACALAVAMLSCAVDAKSDLAHHEREPVRYDWRNVTVGAGGFAPGVIFSGARGGSAYLRTDMGGAYRWDAARRRWIALQDATGISSYMGNESLATDPVDPRKVYMAVGMYAGEPAAILGSKDAGTHWRTSPLPLSMGGNEDGRGLGERLAIAPYDRQTLLFGSRHDGLWASSDGAVTWQRQAGFPYRGRGEARDGKGHGGIAFVVFDPRPGQKRIYAGVADPGDQGLWQSDDGAEHWHSLQGGPPGLLPVKAAIDASGTLFVTYANGIGPNGIGDGAVWSITSDGVWSDITPARPNGDGGYMGVAVDPTRPGTLAVASIDRWHLGDTIWLSHDRGKNWVDLGPGSRRNIAATPYLAFGQRTARMGHWMTGLAFDPFHSGVIVYATGATVYRSDGAPSGQPMTWRPWVAGMEQTAILTLVSPTGGAPLISGFGDIGGFVHRNLDHSPPTMFLNPLHTNTTAIDYAGRQPRVLVRAGQGPSGNQNGAGLAWSNNGGQSWVPMTTPEASDATAPEHLGRAQIAVTADGLHVLAVGRDGWLGTGQGSRWQKIEGLPAGVQITTDKVLARNVYAFSPASGRLFRSVDGGYHFAAIQQQVCPVALGPIRTGTPFVQASPLHGGELIVLCDSRLLISHTAGTTFEQTDGPHNVSLFSLGLGRRHATAIYAASRSGTTLTLWRSLDDGHHWQPIDNRGHRWGDRWRVIAGDPRRVGRVYIGTDGRGIFYGDPAKVQKNALHR